jgi:two-component system, OmpR family, response regulator
VSDIYALCVDDDPDIRTLMSLSLRLDPDFRVEVVDSVPAALDVLADPQQRVDVIISDMSMPEMTGDMLARMVPHMPHRAGIPVILLTARVREQDIAYFGSLDVAGVLSKPFDPITLAKDVKRLVSPWTASRR